MIGDVVGEVADRKKLRVVQEVAIVIDVDQFPDQDRGHTLDQEVVVVHDHMIGTEDIDVAGNAEI